ncbi:CCA tRNA nucleotidyltransferase [Ornithinibacillus contaminans]|uniref:CCA tRNA nucleotidyltransferase n=1 Tax=Ornithinibacillus contaminans TaxID=694055 RepID=UPI00064DCB38|nr:CCA tRNA nucleotidyltransferase [Ornithinibacillus contaminans]
MKQLPNAFREALFIIQTIEAAGHQAYFVGGCVRDLFLQRSIGDIDITTSATPEVILELFDQVIPVGIEHGTVIVRHAHVSYEVTTFRVEGKYSDQRHPDSVEFIEKIDKDLERRDFTINALAMDKNGTIIDLFQGEEDLKRHLIRTVGNGVDRFKEDPLRILRAIRFSSQLGFSIEEETKQAILAVKPNLEGLAIERITKELQKTFAGDSVTNGLNYIHELEIDKHLPVLKELPLLQVLPRPIKPLQSLAEVVCLIHSLKQDLSIRAITRNWKCSNKIVKESLQLHEAICYYKLHGLDNWLVYQLLPDLHNSFSRLTDILFPKKVETIQLASLLDSLPIKHRSEIKINGNDLVSMFPNETKGPWIQKLLTAIEKQVVLGNIRNETSLIKDWIKWNPPVTN